MKLILVRHGETQEGKKGIVLGSLGGTLTSKGKKEAREIAQELIRKEIIPNIIISSPLKRAFDTAQIISKTIKVPVVINPLTRERSAGIIEGKNEKNIDWKLYEKKPIPIRKHRGGESFTEVYKRAEKFIQELQKHQKSRTILVISHSVFILMCIAVLKKENIEYTLKHKPKKLLTIIKIKKEPVV
jgi:broad specificity phosphatase PhoE